MGNAENQGMPGIINQNNLDEPAENVHFTESARGYSRIV